MSTQTGKDVLYIDIDDEITTIIDKVRGSEEKIVALVLPKRATVFQSIVNMKLLKRSADESKKHLVLITSEAGLLPLAGAVGVYVAKSLQSRPEIPTVPGDMQRPADDAEESVNMNDEPKLDKNRAVGDYAGAAPGTVVGAASSLDDDRPIELDNASMDTPAGPPSKAAAAKAKKDKRLKIPDFNKFRTWIILGGVGLVFIIFLFWIALGVMPRATVLVKTDSEAIPTNLDVTLSTSADEVNVDSAVVPAVAAQTEKTATQQVAATGQKDKGQKASGPVSMNAGPCTGEAPESVPAGTGISSNGLTYITQSTVSFSPSFTKGKCTWAGSDTEVVAQSSGEKFNISSNTSFSVAGHAGVSATSSGISGGTSNIVKVVQQSDIDGAKQKIASQDANSVKADLKNQLKSQGVRPIESTLTSTPSDVTTNVQVGAEAEAVTVSQKTTYTMTGAKDSDLKKLIASEVNKEIDPSKQTILDYGLDEAEFKMQNQNGKTVLVALDSTAVAGTSVNVNDMKKQVAGKKSADAKEIIGKYPGVTSVDVHYSPFWVSSIPKNTGKITISIEKPAIKDAN